MNLIIQTNQKIEKGLRDSYLSMQSFLPDVDWKRSGGGTDREKG